MRFREGAAQLAPAVTLPYVECGDTGGAPVVLLHGYVDSWRSFERVLHALPAWIRAVAPSQRGHGDATKLPDGYRVDDFVADLTRFLDVVGLDRAVLVASSSAGFTARRIAAEHPERVSGLILLGVPWSLRERAPSLPFVDAVSALTDPVAAGFVRDFVVGTSSERVPADFLETMVEESLKVPAHVWKQTLEGLVAETTAGTESITAATLVVWGDQDVLAPREDQEKLTAAIEGSRLLVYEDVGHVVHWEQPTRVAADVAVFAEAIA